MDSLPNAQVSNADMPDCPSQTDEILRGRVKWFDVSKGYGFVIPDDGSSDVLIHYNLLAPIGRKSLPEGATLRLSVRHGARGRQGATILDLDLSSATGPDHDRLPPPRGGHHQNPLDFLEQAGDFEPVQVRWFNRTRGYGFLLRNDGVTQIFIHMETVRRGGLEGLHPGEFLAARVHDGPRGALAVDIRPEPAARD